MGSSGIRHDMQGDIESEATATVALISDSLWARRFGRDPGVLGTSLELNETRYTVVGVLPASFRLPMGSADVLVPLVTGPTISGGRPAPIQLMLRLTPGIDRAVAEGELSTLIDDGSSDPYRIRLRDAAELAGTTMRSALMVLMAAVSCVLLIACTNVAHLLMARNVGRRQELTVRTALGATRTRLFLQLMTEHVVLGVTGGIVGAVVAWLSIEGLAAWRPADLTALIDADQPVVMVSEQTAARFWPGTSAVGQRLRLHGNDDWSTVIGVVGDVSARDRPPAWAQIYLPFTTSEFTNTPSLVVRTAGATAATMEAIRSRIQLLDDRVVVTSLETLDTLVSRANVRPRFNAILLGLLAAIGLILAVTGVYGVISYSVGLRTREFGVRVALGAAPAALDKSVLGEAATVGLTGVACGLGLWMLAGRGLASLLVGLDSTDTGTLVLVSALILASTLLAAWLPARRAVRIDPVEALRAEA